MKPFCISSRQQEIVVFYDGSGRPYVIARPYANDICLTSGGVYLHQYLITQFYRPDALHGAKPTVSKPCKQLSACIKNTTFIFLVSYFVSSIFCVCDGVYYGNVSENV